MFTKNGHDIIKLSIEFFDRVLISVRPVLQSKYTPRYLILLTQCIGLPLICIPQTDGLGPPKVISWLFVGLNPVLA